MGDVESRTRTLPYLRSQFNAPSFLSSFAKHHNTQHYFHASLHHFPKCYGLQLQLKRRRFLKYSFISRERRGKKSIHLFILHRCIVMWSISYTYDSILHSYTAVEAISIEQFDFFVFPSLICSFNSLWLNMNSFLFIFCS